LEVVGAGQQPAGDLAGLRDRWVRPGRGERLPEGPDVAADGLLAAGPAALLQFGVERGSVGDAFVLIELRFPAGGLAQQSPALPARANRCTVLRSSPVARLIADSDSPA
jgi:hypothetical protein